MGIKSLSPTSSSQQASNDEIDPNKVKYRQGDDLKINNLAFRLMISDGQTKIAALSTLKILDPIVNLYGFINLIVD